MYAILVYDICKDENGQRRWNRVFKLCKQNLVHIQKSVFEGEISESDLFRLERQIEREIDKHCDSVIIFKSRNERWLDKSIIGLQQEDVRFI
ncbi:CRISPR-associated endonuclease Cas2 [Bacteroides heparinolyticus]|uniref:CRISPR-associated endonuclease Cas2 n=1 Tax=Prevotella heparinolytica TaxID=28113 RepID=UPI0035A05AFC